MGRHRVQKRINRYTSIQRLFDNNIDFDNNVVPDSVSGFDVSLIGANNVNLPSDAEISFADNLINFSNDFTYLINFKNNTSSISDFKALLRESGGANLSLVVSDIGRNFSLILNGTTHQTGILSSEYANSNIVLALKKAGTTWNLWAKGVNILTVNTSFIPSQNNDLSIKQTVNASNLDVFGSAFVPSAISDIDLSLILTNYDLYNYIIDNNLLTSNYFRFTEGKGIHYDIINGALATSDVNVLFNSVNPDFFNLKLGFDLYTNDLFPADIVEYLPLV